MDFIQNKKPRRRVKPGELSQADLLSGETLYLVGADNFFTDNTYKRSPGGIGYELGRPINTGVCKAIAAHVDDMGAKSTLDWLRACRSSLSIETLFRELMDIDGIGPKTAVLLCIAIRNEMPPIKYILANDIHKAIFIEEPEEGMYGAASRGDNVSTAIQMETAVTCARVLARRAINSLPYKDMPTIDEVVNLVGNGTTVLNGVRGRRYLINTKLYEAEQGLLELAKTKVNPVTDSFTDGDICDEQAAFLKSFLESDKKLFLLQGGPGSGKSHVIRKLFQIYSNLGYPVLITSYTNKACANLTERIPDYEYKPLDYRSVRSICSISAKLGFSGKLIDSTRLLIVDESSMVSSSILSKLLDILDDCHADCKLLLVGDINQLPPVKQYGKPFKRIWDLGVADHFEFSEFHRSDSREIFNAFSKMVEPGLHQIACGRSVNIATVRDSMDAAIIVSKVFERERDHIKDIGCCTELKRQAHDINKACIGRLFPDMPKADYIRCTAKGEEYINTPAIVGLRVLSIATIPCAGLSAPIGKNEIGTVVAVDGGKVSVTMDIMGRTVTVETKNFPMQFKPGYATTVHKFQGSEADTIMYVMTDTSNGQADIFSTQKELKYVGMSRAKKTLDIISIDPGCPSRCVTREKLSVVAKRSPEPRMSI